MTRVVCIGDLHLDYAGQGYDYHDDVRDRLYEIDVRSGDRIVQLGDLADPDRGPRTMRAVCAFAEWVGSLPDDVSVEMIPGNHCTWDHADANSILDILTYVPGIRVWSKVETSPLGQYRALYLPWLSRAHGSVDVLTLAREAMDKHPTDKFIAFCHLDIAGATPGSDLMMPRLGQLFLPDELVADPRIERIIAGHHHEPATLGKIEIVGSLECLGFGEKNDRKGYLTIEV